MHTQYRLRGRNLSDNPSLAKRLNRSLLRGSSVDTAAKGMGSPKTAARLMTPTADIAVGLRFARRKVGFLLSANRIGTKHRPVDNETYSIGFPQKLSLRSSCERDELAFYVADTGADGCRTKHHMHSLRGLE